MCQAKKETIEEILKVVREIDSVNQEFVLISEEDDLPDIVKELCNVTTSGIKALLDHPEETIRMMQDTNMQELIHGLTSLREQLNEDKRVLQFVKDARERKGISPTIH
jgi:hypothetical protein